MPRPDAYLTDEDDDAPRRAAASGGVPGWVWGVGGAAVFVGLLVGSFAVAFFNRRDALRREHVARAEAVQAEAQARAAKAVEAEPGPGGPLRVVPLEQFVHTYKTGGVTAGAHNVGKRFRIHVRVQVAGEGWVGTSAGLGAGQPGATASNVIFRLADDLPAPGETVVIEGTCAGLSPGPAAGPMRGPTLIFTDCHVVRE